jgi:hypothetical protein
MIVKPVTLGVVAPWTKKFAYAIKIIWDDVKIYGTTRTWL